MVGRQLIVTLRSEYLFDGFVCIAQRERGAHEWTDKHPIVGMSVVGAFRHGEGYILGVPPRVGARMILGEDSLSSEVVAIELAA
jgi:hypothetical protein